MGNIRSFLLTVLNHWVALMSGGIILVMLTLWERHSSRNVPSWFFWGIVVLMIFLAFYLAWRDKHLALLQAEKALEEERQQNRPNFIPSIEQVATGRYLQLDCPIMFVLMSIRNTGAQSIAGAWSLTLKGNGMDKTVPAAYLGERKHLSGESVQGVLRVEDTLYEKTQQPIPHNGIVSGWLVFVIEGAKVGSADVPGTKFTISFRDVYGKIYEASDEFTATPSPLMYVPGAGKVIQPKTEKPSAKPSRNRRKR